MKQKFFNKSISLLLLFCMAGSLSAGCMCTKGDCCYLIPFAATVSPGIHECAEEGCDCGCTSDQCSTMMQNSAAHQHTTALQTMLRILGQPSSSALFHTKIQCLASVRQRPTPVGPGDMCNPFLYSSKTVSLLI